MKTVMMQRVVLNKEERAIAKTWGSDWARIRADVKKYGRACILTGEWTGYNAGQRRVCHSEYSRRDHYQDMVLKQIVFSDGTSLFIDIGLYTIEQILKLELRRINGYGELIREARGAMVETFYVGRENTPEQEKQECLSGCGCEDQARGHEGPCKFKDQTEEPVKQEQVGKNWYDRD